MAKEQQVQEVEAFGEEGTGAKDAQVLEQVGIIFKVDTLFDLEEKPSYVVRFRVTTDGDPSDGQNYVINHVLASLTLKEASHERRFDSMETADAFIGATLETAETAAVEAIKQWNEIQWWSETTTYECTKHGIQKDGTGNLMSRDD